jgi:hypothetical protein
MIEAREDCSLQNVRCRRLEQLVLRLTSTQSSSRSVSPEAPKQRSASRVPELPLAVKEFLNQVSSAGFPSKKSTKAKAQPWRDYWSGPEEGASDGNLIVACPKICTYGTFDSETEALLTSLR